MQEQEPSPHGADSRRNKIPIGAGLILAPLLSLGSCTAVLIRHGYSRNDR